MHLICNLIRQDEPTRNGRVYSKEALDRIVEQSNRASETKQCLLVEDTGGNGRVRLTDVIGLVQHALVEDGRLHVEAQILDTPKGKLFTAASKHTGTGFRVTVCPMLVGSTNEMKVDPDSLRLTGWTVVRPDPVVPTGERS